MKYAEFTEEEKEFLERRSTENLIEIYRDELLRVIDGEYCPSFMPRGVRKRLRKADILLKVGPRYEVTPLGREMLSRNAQMP